MGIQLKQRIVGIIVGGIFIVIAVLFLFSGSKSKQQVTATTAQTTELQLPQHQQDTVLVEHPGQVQPATLSAAPVPTTQTQPGLPAVPAVSPQQPVATEAKQIKATPKMLLPQPHKTIENGSIASAVAATPNVSAPSSQVVTAAAQPQPPTTATKIVADISKKNAHKKNAVVSDAAQKGMWMVNAGLYQEKTKAENFLRKLKADGYRASIQKGKLKNKIYYRVVVGPMSGKDKAEKLAQKVEKVFKVKTALIPAAVKKAALAKKSKKPLKATKPAV